MIGLGVMSVAADETMYQEARRAHLQGDWESAIAKYQQVVDGDEDADHVAASYLYIGLCTARQGRLDEAAKALRPIVDGERGHAYVGEAALELARLHYERGEDTEALRAIAAGLAWIDTQPEDTTMEKPVPTPSLIRPDDLLSPTSAMWYLPALEGRLLELRVFGVVRKPGSTEAQQALRDLRDFLKVPGGTGGETRSWFVEDAADGALIISPAGDAALDGHSEAGCLRLAFFDLAIGNARRARVAFENVRQANAQGKGPADIWAAAVFGLAACDHAQDNDTQAARRLIHFTGALRATALSPHARLCLANLNAKHPQTRVYDAAIRLYGDLITEANDDTTKQRVLLWTLTAAANRGDAATVYRAMERLQAASPTGIATETGNLIVDVMNARATVSTPSANAALRSIVVTDADQSGLKWHYADIDPVESGASIAFPLANCVAQSLAISAGKTSVAAFAIFVDHADTHQVLVPNIYYRAPLAYPQAPGRPQEPFFIPMLPSTNPNQGAQ